MSADNTHGYPQSIEIWLLGPTQVGKTSLLATMYHTMTQDLPKSFSFEPLEQHAFETLTVKRQRPVDWFMRQRPVDLRHAG